MPTRPRVLLYSRTTGYRHDSIPAALDALRDLTAEMGGSAHATEDPDAFEDAADLAGYDVVVFVSTSGDVLTPRGRLHLAAHHAAGAGFMGVHSAACTEYDWPYFGDLVGARFARHPEPQPGRILVEDRTHPATEHLGAVWECTDEWYDFRTNPRTERGDGRRVDVPDGPVGAHGGSVGAIGGSVGVRVLACADEASYRGAGMGADHPLVWCHRLDGAPVFYTALGHAAERYADPIFRRHLLGGLRSVVPDA